MPSWTCLLGFKNDYCTKGTQHFTCERLRKKVWACDDRDWLNACTHGPGLKRNRRLGNEKRVLGYFPDVFW